MRNKLSSLPQGTAGPHRLTILALCAALACASPAVFAQSSADAVVSQRAAPFWQNATVSLTAGAQARTAAVAKTPALQLTRMHAATLDMSGLQAFAASAPREQTGASLRALQSDSLTISLPHPDGGYQSFSLVEAPIMEEGLAAKHPDIKTYRGVGIDDPKATLRMDITPLGLHASVRSPNGGFFVDPYYKNDTSVYASYGRGDLVNQHGPFSEGAPDEVHVTLSRGFYNPGETIDVNANGFTAGARVTLEVRAEGTADVVRTLSATADKTGAVKVTLPAGTLGAGGYEVAARSGEIASSTVFMVLDAAGTADAISGPTLRTYRLALVTDPTYAAYFGAENVTAAKVTLINRVTQIYEDETSIRMVLIEGNDALNLNTAAQMTGVNGPCGANACYSTAQASSCTSGTLTRNRVVAGLLVGAGTFDIGHIALGNQGGGVASLGVVGGTAKAQGCTGVPTPVGDFFAVDYTAHEMGHQFSGNHTFNGVITSCSASNRNAATSVEPGSGSSIMAYAGICGTDNLQAHSDPYWSQRSFDEITTYTSAADILINEIQMSAVTGYTVNGAQYQFSYNGQLSAPIIRGTNNTVAGIKAAIEAIPGWPSGGVVTATLLSDATVTLTFSGSLAGVNIPNLQLVNPSAGVSGYISDITSGGLTTRRGAVTQTGNATPVVTTAAAQYTIPVRTPFTLTGSATDSDENLTYMWEQNDRAAAAGTGLISQPKTNGPLFRQFGTQALVTNTGTLQYNSPGENNVTGNPSRTFPDMAQILANNTNAETGLCPTASTTPTVEQIACFSEFLPTAGYVGFEANANPAALNFRLTVRDGNGGIGNATTKLVLAAAAGPFLVTSPNTAVTLSTGVQTVTWSVANTNVAPVNTANVKISLSTDSGLTFPTVLAESVPNTGSASVTIPAVASTKARIKIEAVGNVFFDVSNTDFTLEVPVVPPQPVAGDVNGDGVVNCADVTIVKASLNKRLGQAGYDARADVVVDNVIDIRDLTFVKKLVPVGTVCN